MCSSSPFLLLPFPPSMFNSPEWPLGISKEFADQFPRPGHAHGMRAPFSLEWMQLFLLTVGSFLLTMELFDLHLAILAFLLTIGAFSLTIFAVLLTIEAFAYSGKVPLISALRDCNQESLTGSKRSSNCK